MKEEREFDKYMREHDKAQTDRLLNDVLLAHPELKEKRQRSGGHVKKRLAWIMPLVSVAVCAAIVIPSVLLTRDVVDDEKRYSTTIVTEFVYNPADSIKAYNEQNGTQICYLNWYDVAETEGARVYVEKGTERFIGIDEEMYNFETDELVYVLAIERFIVCDFLEEGYYYYCRKEQLVGGTAVNWGQMANKDYCAAFTYDNYKYIITVNSEDEDRLFDLIEELIYE